MEVLTPAGGLPAEPQGLACLPPRLTLVLLSNGLTSDLATCVLFLEFRQVFLTEVQSP